MKRHFNPATGIAVVALVFAMTGGAYAASRYVITSTKQISPKVLKSLKGQPGAAGANGAQGPAGPAGAQGPQGPAGAKGETGAAGTNGANGEKGEPGETGFTETLPSEKTETGTWSIWYKAVAAEDPGSSPISFAIPLSEKPNPAHFIGKEEGEGEAHQSILIPEFCKGTSAHPEAVKGNLCVFSSTLLNAHGFKELTGQNNIGASPIEEGTTGALVILASEAGGLTVGEGTWAVTAP